jgi:hypothetical protein
MVFLSEFKDDVIEKALQSLQSIILHRDNTNIKEIVASISRNTPSSVTEQSTIAEDIKAETDEAWHNLYHFGKFMRKHTQN